MLIHGRLLVTDNGIMLDEVKSLLQKALRRKEKELVYKATKELMCSGKDQPTYHSLITFMFEDHCLNHPKKFEALYNLYKRKKKTEMLDVILSCYTSRVSACLQVVAIKEEYTNYKSFWSESIFDPELQGLVSTKHNGINGDLLLQNFARKWREKDTVALTSLSGLLNMAVKVEQRPLTNKGVGILIDPTIKKPCLYQLVLSVLLKHTDADDSYMRRIIKICFRFASIPNVPAGLITITVLSQLMYRDLITSKPVPPTYFNDRAWRDAGPLEVMPSWAVDKHTYRGKTGNSSKELFLKKYKDIELSAEKLEEFHGCRPKADLQTFFDIGTVCNDEILPDNPFWEDAKEEYLKQKQKKMQKCHKMTTLYYFDLRDRKSVVFLRNDDTDSAVSMPTNPRGKRAAPLDEASTSAHAQPESKKKRKIETSQTGDATTASGSKIFAKGPLLQLPTGSGKVYTILDKDKGRVIKGPYKVKQRQNLCMFYHKAMKDVFGDRHTMEITEEGSYLAFPLLKSDDASMTEVNRAFYDCISKTYVDEHEGRFVERESLGIVQLHKLPATKLRTLPVSVWAHFVWRYVLNVGDSGLYNAIATKELDNIYGIDMEETRGSDAGNDVISMMFSKRSRKDVVVAIKQSIMGNIEEFYELIKIEVDYKKLKVLYQQFKQESKLERCKERIAKFLEHVDVMCQKECGI